MLIKSQGNISKLGKKNCKLGRKYLTADKEGKEKYKPSHEEVKRLKLTTCYVPCRKLVEPEISVEKTIYKIFSSQLEYREKKMVLTIGCYLKKNGTERKEAALSQSALENFCSLCMRQSFKFLETVEEKISKQETFEEKISKRNENLKILDKNLLGNIVYRSKILKETLKLRDGDIMLESLSKKIEDLLGGEPEMGVFVCPENLNMFFHFINPAAFATWNVNFVLLDKKKKDGRNSEKPSFKFESLPKITVISFEGLDPLQELNRKLMYFNSYNTQYISIVFEEGSVDNRLRMDPCLRYVPINLFPEEDKYLEQLFMEIGIMPDEKKKFEDLKKTIEWGNKELYYLFEKIVFKVIQKWEPDLILLTHNFSLNKTVNPNARVNLTASGFSKILQELSFFVSNRLIVVTKSIPEQFKNFREEDYLLLKKEYGEFIQTFLSPYILSKFDKLDSYKDFDINDLNNEYESLSDEINNLSFNFIKNTLSKFALNKADTTQTQTYIAEMTGAIFSAILGQMDFNSLKTKNYTNCLEQPSIHCCLLTVLNIRNITENKTKSNPSLQKNQSNLSFLKNKTPTLVGELIKIEKIKNTVSKEILPKFREHFHPEFESFVGTEKVNIMRPKESRLLYKKAKSTFYDSIFIGSTRIKLKFLDDDKKVYNFYYKKDSEYFVKLVDEDAEVYYVIFLNIEIRGKEIFNFCGYVEGKKLVPLSIYEIHLKKFPTNKLVHSDLDEPVKLVESAMSFEIPSVKRKGQASAFSPPQINLFQFGGNLISLSSKTVWNNLDLFELQLTVKPDESGFFDVEAKWERHLLKPESIGHPDKLCQFSRIGGALLPLNNYFVLIGGLCTEPSVRSYITNNIDYIHRKSLVIKRLSKEPKQGKSNYTDTFINPLLNPCVIQIKEKKPKKKSRKFWLIGGEHSSFFRKSDYNSDRPLPQTQNSSSLNPAGSSSQMTEDYKEDEGRQSVITRYVVEFSEAAEKIELTSFKSEPIILPRPRGYLLIKPESAGSLNIGDSWFAKSDRCMLENNKEIKISIMKWAKGARKYFEEVASIQIKDGILNPLRSTYSTKLNVLTKIPEKEQKQQVKLHCLDKRTLFYSLTIEKLEVPTHISLDVNGLEVFDCFEQAESIYNLQIDFVSKISEDKIAYFSLLDLHNNRENFFPKSTLDPTFHYLKNKKNHLCIFKNMLYALHYHELEYETGFVISIEALLLSELLNRTDDHLKGELIAKFCFKEFNQIESNPKIEALKTLLTIGNMNDFSFAVNENFFFMAGSISSNKFMLIRAANKSYKEGEEVTLFHENSDLSIRLLDLEGVVDCKLLRKPHLICINKFILALPSKFTGGLGMGLIFNKKESLLRHGYIVLNMLDSTYENSKTGDSIEIERGKAEKKEGKCRWLAPFVSDDRDKKIKINLFLQIRSKSENSHSKSETDELFSVFNPPKKQKTGLIIDNKHGNSILEQSELKLFVLPFEFKAESFQKPSLFFEEMIEESQKLDVTKELLKKITALKEKNKYEDLLGQENMMVLSLNINVPTQSYRLKYKIMECLIRNETKMSFENIHFYVPYENAFRTPAEIAVLADPFNDTLV